MSAGDDFWAEVQRLAGALDRSSYYQLLDIPGGAVADEIRAAYARRVSAYHPDRHARERDPARRRALVSLQARFNEAYRVLSDPRERADYDRALAGGQVRWLGRSTVEDPQSLQARRYFQFGKDCERGGDRAGAIMNYQFALQLEPGSAVVREALSRLDPRTAAASTPPPVTEPAAVAPTAPPVDQRAAARIPYAHPVRLTCPSWKHFVTLYARDVSAGGMFLRTSTTFDVGARLDVSIVAPDGRVLTLAAEVAHVISADRARAGATPGIGIRFLEIDADRRALIDDLLREAGAAADRASRPQRRS